MKRCPECGTTYPDTESYCARDGASLAALGTDRASGSTQTMFNMSNSQATQILACPACGARVEPQERNCPYCGTELPYYGPEQDFPQDEFSDEGEIPTSVAEETSSGRRILAVIGYGLAAVAALAAGIGIAIWVAPKSHRPTSVSPSVASLPTPAPAAPSNPILRLVNKPPLQVEVSSSSGGKTISPSQAAQTFEDNKDALLDKYKQTLGGGAPQDDGLWVEAEVGAEGRVSAVSILTSTAHDPGIDAELAKEMLKWSFPTSEGPFKVRYPIIFASDPNHVTEIEKALEQRVAGYNPASLAEYRMAKVQPTPTLAAVPSPVAPPALPSPAAPKVPVVAPSVAPPAPAPTPEHARLTPPPAPAVPPPSPSLRERVERALLADPRFASVRASVNGNDVTLTGRVSSEADRIAAIRAVERIPGVGRVNDQLTANPPLLERVKEALHSDRRFRRVDAYTNGGVVTLFGKVVTDREKAAAQKLVAQLPGVTGVINNITTDTDEWRAIQQRIADNLASAGLTKVTVEVIGKYAYLNGEVNSEQDKQRAVAITESTAPVKVEMNMIRVVPKGLF